MNQNLKLYGSPYSVYVRIVRLTLLEKQLPYCLKPIDIFGKNDLPLEYQALHPFGKIPALVHNDVVLYETGAIARYLDEGFPGPDLFPSEPLARAKVNQIISIVDNYAYPALVWGIYVPLNEQAGTVVDNPEIQRSIETADRILKVLDEFLLNDGPLFCGHDISLADIYMAPVIDYFLRTDIGADKLSEAKNLENWWLNTKNRNGYHDILSDA